MVMARVGAIAVTWASLRFANSQLSPPNGAAGCRCSTTGGWRASYTDTSTGTPLLTATVASGAYGYPFDYGLGTCEQWDASREPLCADANGPLADAPSWCGRRWCFVDPDSCDELDVQRSSYFPDVEIYYSYSTCGDANTFSQWEMSRSCAARTSPMTCSQLKASTGATTWGDRLGNAEVCAASPKPCAFYHNFFQAAELCRSEGARLCTLQEILNNEAGGTGCSMDALEVWTSSRGTCVEGEFITVAGAAYNAVPVPLGIGTPGCTPVTEPRSVRCCGDDVVAQPTCPSSTATCDELGWAVVPADESGNAFCPESTAVYDCADGAGGCYERFARSCTADELASAAASIAGFPDGVQEQLRSGHGVSDQCMCCADDSVMPEPCLRPYRVQASSTSKQLTFGVDTSEARRCYWAFDGCGSGEGVELTFKQADVTDSIQGDGWKVFAASSPVNLLAVQNMKFSRASVLAEIYSAEARTFKRTLHDNATRIKTPHGEGFVPRTANSEYVVRSPVGAVVELKVAEKGVAPASFAVEYRCAPVTGGCMDSAATNFRAGASHDDGSCNYLPSGTNWTDESGYRCTSNPKRSGTNECTCVVADSGDSFFFDARIDHVVRSADPFETVLEPYLTERCSSSASSSVDFISQVNAAADGLHWLRFYGALLDSDIPLQSNHETVVIDGLTRDPNDQSSLPELNVRIAARMSSRAFVRRVAVRNKVAEGNAPVAIVQTGSVLIMVDVRLEQNMATGFHGAIFCDSNTACVFFRVAFVKNSANENGALGGWGSVYLRDVQFSDNWSLRGSSLFQNRAKASQSVSCSTDNDCGWLQQCYAGLCEHHVSIVGATFTNNVATGDFGGAIARGTSGFDVSMHIDETVMLNNYASLYGTAIASLSSDVRQSRPFSLHNSTVSPSPLSSDQSAIYLHDISEWILHTVDFGLQFSPRLVAADTKATDCASAITPPCPGGFSCSMLNESIQCLPCAAGTVSMGRGSCETCSPGSGPTREQDGCEPCKGNDYSAAGICRPCAVTLVVAPSVESCITCPEFQTAMNDSTNLASANSSRQRGRVCGCKRGYINASATLPICYESGFDLSTENSERRVQQDSIKHNQCLLCPQDRAGDTCMVCSVGETHIAAGFRMLERTLTSVPHGGSMPTDGRRLQMLPSQPEIVSVFKCHREPDLARKRCPACTTPPCPCALGYTGFFCGQCAEPSELHLQGFGKEGDDCVECEGAFPTHVLALAVVGVTTVLGTGLWILARAWKADKIKMIKHLVKSCVTPAKSCVVYFQVVIQLGQVLDFTWPGAFGDLIATVKPIFEWWRVVFFFIGPGECYGLRDYTAWWITKVFGGYAILSALILAKYLYDVRARHAKTKGDFIVRVKGGETQDQDDPKEMSSARNGHMAHINSADVDAPDETKDLVSADGGQTEEVSPEDNAVSHVSVAVFFLYPGTCQLAFEVSLCRQVSPTEAVFELDDRLLCSSHSYQVMQYLAIAVTILCALVPSYALKHLLAARRAYKTERKKAIERLSRIETQASETMGVSLKKAKWVVEEVVIGSKNKQGWQTLTSGYKPQYIYWETIDMYRKFTLVGVVTWFPRRSVSQLVVAVAIAVVFLMMHAAALPFKTKSDNLFRASTEVHVFITVFLALVLRNDLQYEGYAEQILVHAMFWSFILFVPCVLFTTIALKMKEVRNELKKNDQDDKQGAQSDKKGTPKPVQERVRAFHLFRLGLADYTERIRLERWFQGWKVKKQHAVFISHLHSEAAPEARILKDQLSHCLNPEVNKDVFLDSGNSMDDQKISELKDKVAQSDVMIVLYTQRYLADACRLAELQATVTAEVPIIVLPVGKDSPYYANPCGKGSPDADRHHSTGPQNNIAKILDNLPDWIQKTVMEQKQGHGRKVIVMSCPEMGTRKQDGSGPYDAHVMDKVQELQQHGTVKMGFDRAGTSTQDKRDSDEGRKKAGKSPVDWTNPVDIKSTHWWDGFKTAAKRVLSTESQGFAGVIEVICIEGGPITRVEAEEMGQIVKDAKKDAEKSNIHLRVNITTLSYHDFLRQYVGQDLREHGEIKDLKQFAKDIKEKLVKATLDRNKMPRAAFRTHCSRKELDTQIGNLACALVEEDISPENRELVDIDARQLVDLMAKRKDEEIEAWPVERTFAVYVAHQLDGEGVSLIENTVQKIRYWLTDTTDLGEGQVCLACDREDKNREQPIGVERDSVGAEGEALDRAFHSMTQEADCVLLLQSAEAVYEPEFLATAFAAIAFKVPICCAFFTGKHPAASLAPFEDFSSLSTNLDGAKQKELMRLIGKEWKIELDDVLYELQKALSNCPSRGISLGSPTEKEMLELGIRLRASFADLYGQPIGRQLRDGSSGQSTDSGTGAIMRTISASNVLKKTERLFKTMSKESVGSSTGCNPPVRRTLDTRLPGVFSVDGESTGRKSYKTLANEYTNKWRSATEAKQDELVLELEPEPEPELEPELEPEPEPGPDARERRLLVIEEAEPPARKYDGGQLDAAERP